MTAGRVLVGVLFAGVFLVNEDFWLFSLFGVKTEAQLLLYAGVGVVSLPFLLKARFGYLREPLVLLAISHLLTTLVYRRENDGIANELIEATLIVLLTASVMSLSKGYRTAVTKAIIVIFSGLAAIGIIEFIILLFAPELTNQASAAVFEAGYLSGRPNVSPLMFLGFTTGEHYQLFGFPLTRVSSFLKEPSFMVPYFLVPAVLALSYRGITRFLAIPLLMFALLSLSGSVWVSILVSTLMAPVFLLSKRRTWPLTIAPMAAVLLLGTIVLAVGTRDIVETMAILMDPVKTYGTFLEKENSVISRIEGIREGIENVGNNWLGVRTAVPASGGVFFFSFFSAGYIGGILAIWVFYEYFRRLADFARLRRQLLFSILLYGCIFEVLVFSSSGVTSASGFMILSLALMRLRETSRLEDQAAKQSQELR